MVRPSVPAQHPRKYQRHHTNDEVDGDDTRHAPHIERIEEMGLRVLFEDDRTNQKPGKYEENVDPEPPKRQKLGTVRNFAKEVRNNDDKSRHTAQSI
jgi:hypothetical protein